jgi:hypothetical protein
MRVEAMKRAHPNVVAVAPTNKGIAHCLPFDTPDEWLPEVGKCADHEREWFKCDAMGLAAVAHHQVDADYYWFIEADVAASQARWKAFFETFKDRKDDCLCTFVNLRGQDPGFSRRWNGAPEGANKHFLMALYRLSRPMVERSIQMAEEMRNVFSEIAVPWVVESGGGKVSRLTGGHFNRMTFGVQPKYIRPDKNLISHPMKGNTFEP